MAVAKVGMAIEITIFVGNLKAYPAMVGQHFTSGPVAHCLAKLVPAQHFYQCLDQAVDFSFVRPLFTPYYSAIGRPSLDPVVFFKLLLVSHFENITSDRKLIELAGLHLGIRSFLGYELHQALPWHSTLSRTRQRIPVAVFEECFSHIVGLCIQKGLVSGHTQVIDSAYIKANASISRLKIKQASWNTDTNSRLSKPKESRLNASKGRLQHIYRFHTAIQKATSQKAGQLLSNLTHYSPTDPDARIGVKPGKQRMLAYLANLSVDSTRHVITHIHADYADRRDSRYLLAMVDQTQARLSSFGVTMVNVVADSGYGSGQNYQQLEQRGIQGYIPPHGKYKPDRKGFSYDATTDSYRCGQQKVLAFDKVVIDKEGNLKKRYRAKASDCKACRVGQQCKGKKASEKRLHHTLYKAQYERMAERLSSRFGKRMMRLRSATVEPVLGSLINYYGLRKIGVRGQAGAAKVMYLAAMAYNLKKYLHYQTGKCLSQASAMVVHLTNGFLYLRTFATATTIMLRDSSQNQCYSHFRPLLTKYKFYSPTF